MNEKTKNMIYGSVAGAISRTIVAPIERLKVISQINPSVTNTSMYSNIRHFYVTEGIRGLFAGNLTNCIRIVPKSGIQYASYKVGEQATGNKFLGGAFSGLVTATSTYPLELIRTNLTVQTNNAKYKGIMDCTMQIYKTQGLTGYYRGIVPCLLGVIPFYAINFGIYEFANNHLGDKLSITNSDIVNKSLTKFTSGTVSIFTALSVCFPSDLIKKRLQLRGQYNIPNYSGLLDCVKHIHQTEGFFGFYSGIRADYVKMIPANGMFFVIIGLFHEYLFV